MDGKTRRIIHLRGNIWLFLDNLYANRHLADLPKSDSKLPVTNRLIVTSEKPYCTIPESGNGVEYLNGLQTAWIHSHRTDCRA